MAEANKIDPFNVEALEKSLNDSATRVSTIWVSFLIFSLYLLIAATTVDHRQLLLAEPVKLPVLNIDLPLWGFFFLAPILFVILHFYVLLQVLLLGRTAAAYNDAIDHAVRPPLSNATIRQRLANTLFAQIFAGSPREREGWLGWLLKGMAWTTLVIAPVLILLVFQFAFLAYHSHLATWTHRILIFIELAAAFSLWPLILDAQRDSGWSGRKWVVPLVSCATFVFFSLTLATFPGEPHINLFTGQPISSVQCDRWFSGRFDRLYLPGVDVVDEEKFRKIEEATTKSSDPPSRSERTKKFRDRDLNCSNFSDYADLRRIDLTRAQLRGATLRQAKLQAATLVAAQFQGADFEGAQLQDADLTQSHLEGASLRSAQLRGAILDEANLRGASLINANLQNGSLVNSQLEGASLHVARLQGAILLFAELRGARLNNAHMQKSVLSGARLQGAQLVNAQLQGAFLNKAELQGASLDEAELQGASLQGAELQGASLQGAKLQGASFDGAQLHGTSLVAAELQGASFAGAHLHGVDFTDAELTSTIISDAMLWRAKGAACDLARVLRPNLKAIIGDRYDTEKLVIVTDETINKFVNRATANLPDDLMENIRTLLRSKLATEASEDMTDQAEVWSNCEKKSASISQEEFNERHASFLRDLVCDPKINRGPIAEGVIRNWIAGASNDHATQFVRNNYSYMLLDDGSPDVSSHLARSLLGQNGKACAADPIFNEKTKVRLGAAAARKDPNNALAK